MELVRLLTLNCSKPTKAYSKMATSQILAEYTIKMKIKFTLENLMKTNLDKVQVFSTMKSHREGTKENSTKIQHMVLVKYSIQMEMNTMV